MKPTIIGLGHYARVGKDYFAKQLIHCCGVCNADFRIERRAFADKLKDIANQLYGWAGLREGPFYDTKEGALLREVVLPEIGKSPRQIWVDLGTPAIRANVYDGTWLDYVLRRGLDDLDAVVITDVRFPNEVEAIKALGGTLIKIVRDGYGPGDNVADRAVLGYSGWDLVIGRASTRESTSGLDDWAFHIARNLAKGRAFYQNAESLEFNMAVEREAIKQQEHKP